MIKISWRGVDELRAYLPQVIRGVKDIAARAFTEYLIGDEAHGLKHYTPYQYVSMQSAYGGFVSDRQRRYVMARIREGTIDPGVPHRTGNMQRGWQLHQYEAGRYGIRNEVEHTKYVMGDDTQSRMHQMIGWRKMAEVVSSNIAGAYRHAQAKVREWLRSRR